VRELAREKGRESVKRWMKRKLLVVKQRIMRWSESHEGE
jgi:hypothetical protein